MIVIALFAMIAVTSAGVIQHGDDLGQGHGQATSYQHVKIENYHPVPVYVKKEHSQFLEHPVAKGHTATNVEVHHGGHHDHGYALVSGTHQEAEDGGHEALQAISHDGAGLGGYEGGELAGHGGQEYQLAEAGGHESAGYGHQVAYEQGSEGQGGLGHYGHH